ncbi:MAG: ribosome biogenesis GTPase YqeH [Thomasclavelia sp.]|nr:ribosome biogenesis GTPase YqeH [Thomasclavelia sp.]
MKEIRCYGCGAIIQSDDEKKVGYVPKNAKDKDNILCQRCFKLKNYHELQNSNLTKDDFLRILDSLGNKDCLIVYIIDLFDFNGSMITGLNRHVNNDNIVVVANKRDILPKITNDNKIINWLQHQLKNQGLIYKDIVLTSSKKGYHLNELIDMIETYRNGKDVYVVGVTNVGKSSVINALLKKYGNSDNLITTSEFPGTTLDMIEIPLDDDSAIFDTPGIVNENQFAHYASKETLKYFLPQSELKPMTFQLNSNQSIYIGGVARMDFISGNKCSFTFYVNKQLKLNRCKLENADKNYENDQVINGKLDIIKTASDFKTISFDLPNYKCDIVISGLGFISVKNPGAKISIKVPEGVGVFIREAII